MDCSKYYTPIEIASRLIHEINMESPRSVVDICCGSCNLLLAAKQRWANAEYVGVDINPIQKHIVDRFYQEDGRNFAMHHKACFDLVVANPPFGYMKEDSSYPSIYEHGFECINSSRMEIEMLLANLNLLNKDGVLLSILPSSFVEAEQYLKIRVLLAAKYHIDSIIKLDERTFGSSLINCYAIILRKSKSNRRTVKKDYSLQCDARVPISYIRKDDLRNGVWISKGGTCDLSRWDIKRGNISSSDFVKRGQPVLHTSKPSDDWHPGIRYISKYKEPAVFAETGDIIVSRIGKSAGKWCVYEGDRIPISDCLFRVKDTDGSIKKTISGMEYDRGTKGLTTQYITYSDFVEWVALVRNRTE